MANRIELIPRRRIAAYLGWDPAQAERVRLRVQRRIESSDCGPSYAIRISWSAETSSHLAFKGEINGRRNYWRFAEIAPGFCSIMVDERADLFEPTSAASNLMERKSKRNPRAIAT